MQVSFTDYAAGAAFVTDLLNSAAHVVGTDRIADVTGLYALLREHGLADGDRPPEPRDVREIQRLRERLRAAFDTSDAGQVRDVCADVLAGTPVRLVPPAADGWAAEARPDGYAARARLLAAVSLLTVLRVLGPDRLRACASPTCRGAFVDTSRAGRRRYCMPAICGNRAHVAAYRARRHG